MSFSASAYRTVFEQHPDGLLLIEADTRHIRDCNQRFCELAECDRETVQDTRITKIATASHGAPDDIDAQIRQDSPATDPREWQLRPDAGSPTTVEARRSSVVIDDETYTLVRVSPVTTPSNRLRDRERIIQAVDEAPVGITISDPARDDNPLIYVNDGFQEVTGYSEDEIVGRNCRFLQGENTAADPVREMREAIDAEKPVTVELRNYRKDGTKFWNRVTIAPVYDDDNTLLHFVGFQQDITDWKQYEQDLELARNLLETVPSGVLRTEPSSDGTFEYVNSALVSLLHAESAEQLRDQRVADVYVDPGERDALIETLRTTERDRVRHEVEFQTLDGEIKDVAVTATLTEDETGSEYLHKVVQDITDRKERERELERYERLVENLPIGVFRNTPGPDGEFRFVNEGMVEIFDAESVEQLREHAVSDLYADPDERETLSETLREQGVVTEQELKFDTLDGREIWGSVTAIAHEEDDDVVFDGVVQDITARKQYERQLAEQRDNLDLMNQMLRHDIRNDLQLVTAYADVLADHVDEDGYEYLNTIRESAAHAVELTETARDLADLMHSTDESTESINLRPTLQEEVEDIQSKYANAAITVEGAIPRCSVVANEMLDAVFRNLLTNAIQHNDKEVPEVRITTIEEADTVEVRIADNGPGVPDSEKEAIFGKGEKGLDCRVE